MKRWIAALLGLVVIFTVAACDLNVLEDYELEELDQASYTILVYLNGADLESEYGMATDDLLEMVDADYNRDDIRVVVQTGGSSFWWNFGVPAENPARFLVVDDGIAKLEELSPVSMVESQTLADFIDYGIENFPAERYALVMWNHGGGSVFGFGYDEYHEGELTLAAIGQALKSSKARDTKFEFIGFDACLMASIETAWVVKDYAKYLIASEELEPGYGWDYDNWLSILGDDPDMTGDEIGRVIVDSFIAFYNENDMAEEATTLSCIDLSRIDSAVQALEDFVAVANIDDYGYQEIARPRAATKEFGLPHEYGYSYDMIDIVHMASQFHDICPDEAQALIDAIDGVVVYKSKGSYVEHAGGLSLYFPYSQKSETVERLGVYCTSGFSPVYIDYVIDFAGVLCGQTIGGFDEIGNTKPEQEEDSDEMSIVLTPEELANMASISFTAWVWHDGDTYMQIYQDSFVDIADDGTILTEFDGVVSTINGEWACLYEIEHGDDYIRYGVPAMIQKKGTDHWIDVNLIVIIDDITPDGRVIGAMPNPQAGMAPKQMITIEDGDMITLFYYADEFADIGAEEDENYEGPYWLEGYEFVVDGELIVEHWEAPPDEYLYGFTIWDLQGNEYYTDFIVVWIEE